MGAQDKRKREDPVLADQAGRMTAVDPFGTNTPHEEAVRRRAYELYERRGKEDGQALQDWLEAESQVR